MIGVYINGEQLSGWGVPYRFKSIEEARECCDPYGYMHYEYKEVESGITTDELTTKMVNNSLNKR